MPTAYLDCFAGISGDMFLGALLNAGVPLSVLEDAVQGLGLDATLRVETVDRSGISSTKVHVLEGGKLAEGEIHTHPHEHAHSHSHDQPEAHGHPHSHEHVHEHVHEHTHEGGLTHSHPDVHEHRHEHEHEEPHAHAHAPGHDHGHDHEHDDGHHVHGHRHELGHKSGHGHEHRHDHEHGHSHPHEHPHVHGRSLTEIRRLIQGSALSEKVKGLAVCAFEALGHSEAKIHNVPVDQIHFHEVGAVDAIVDIVAAAAGIGYLEREGPLQWYCSPVNVGGGMVECAHGTFPVPAPATADLLRGMPTYSAHVQKELVTPTGAALLRALLPTFGEQPPMRVQAIGYGAGTRNPEGFPNVLRLSLGEPSETAGSVLHALISSLSSKADDPIEAGEADAVSELRTPGSEAVMVLEAALDDASPQVLAHVAERALSRGALDVMLTPVLMKKGRPGTLITVLCEPDESSLFEELLLRETTTLGIRMHREQRSCLGRHHATVSTQYGEVRVKVGLLGGEEVSATPEFEDCRAAAERYGVPVKQVIQAAASAYSASRAGVA